MNVTDFTDFLNEPLMYWLLRGEISEPVPDIATIPHDIDSKFEGSWITLKQGETALVEFKNNVSEDLGMSECIIAYLNGRPYAAYFDGRWYLGYLQYNGEFIR